MANKFHFFTDFESYTSQDITDRYGPVSDTQFRVDSKIDVQSNAKAYAVCDSQVLVQFSISGNINLILRPLTNTPFNIEKVDYFIYRDINPTSLVNGTEVADRTLNDLTARIWDNQDETDSNSQSSSNVPSIDFLGLSYSTNGSGDFEVLDTNSIDSVFFKDDNIQLVKVNAGEHIGDFVGGSVKAGFEIILEKLGSPISMEIARKDDHLITVSPSSGNNAEEFLNRHKKEEILNYIDSASFYGLFKYYTNDLIINSTQNAQFSVEQLIEKYVNKNRIYLDIRNENGYSINYFQTFGENIGLSLDVSNPPTPLPNYNYYDNNLPDNPSFGSWPILIIETDNITDFTSNNLHGKFILDLPVSSGFVKGFYAKEVRENGEKRSDFTFTEEIDSLEVSSWVYDDNGSLKFGASYIRITLFHDRSVSYSGLYQPGTDVLSYQFPINRLTINWERGIEDIGIKVYQDSGICQHIDYPDLYEDTYACQVGVAEDKNSTYFFTFPNDHIGFIRNNKLRPNFSFVTTRVKDEADFLAYIFELSNHVTAVNIDVEDGDMRHTSLKTLSNITDGIDRDFDTRFFNVVHLTHAEMDQLILLIDSAGFIDSYDIYISTKLNDTYSRNIPDYYIERTQLTLVGIEYVPNTSNTEIQRKEVDTNIYVQSITQK